MKNHPETVDTDLEVLHLDNHILVIDKPAGALAQSDRTGDEDMLTLGKAFLKTEFNKPGNVYLGLIHRLDRPVSGVMVLARTSKAAARLSEQFRSNIPKKKYWAIVEGKCPGEGECKDYLVKENETVRIVDPGHPKSQLAVLSWRSVASRDGRTLLAVDLRTGRPHQIRVQLANMGFPILGDFRYGAKEEFDGRNLALHCYSLEFQHPVRKEQVRFTADPQKSWVGWFDEEWSRLISHRAVEGTEKGRNHELRTP
jgi:RluA family pseudouridine synthase